jgi:hypothetical protein
MEALGIRNLLSIYDKGFEGIHIIGRCRHLGIVEESPYTGHKKRVSRDDDCGYDPKVPLAPLTRLGALDRG